MNLISFVDWGRWLIHHLDILLWKKNNFIRFKNKILEHVQINKIYN